MMISEKLILDNEVYSSNSGKIVHNRTYLYLSPILMAHGEYFVRRIIQDTKRLAFGILDTALSGSPLIEESNRRPIFMLLDMEYKETRLESFMNFIRTEHYYITDYIFDTQNEFPSKRMVVLDVPQEFYNSYDNFKLGKYSEMFTEEQIRVWFIENKVPAKVVKILKRDKTQVKDFIKNIEERLGSVVSPCHVKELDFPYTLDKSAEIFNFNFL